MRNAKRVIALVAIAAMMLSLFSFNVFADATNQQMKVYFETEKASVKAGGTFVVNVFVTDQDGKDITTMMPGVGLSYGEGIESVTVNESTIVAGKTYAASEIKVNTTKKEIICGTMSEITSGAGAPIASLNVKLAADANGSTNFTIIEGAKTGAMDPNNVDFVAVVGNPMEISILEASTIVAVDPVTVNDKAFGTSVEEVLPATVSVTVRTSAGVESKYDDCEVEWDTTAYSPSKVGAQTFTGTLMPKEPVEVGDIKTVTATVTLQPIALAEDVAVADVNVMEEAGKVYTAEEVAALLPATVAVGEGELADELAVTWTGAELDASAEGNTVRVEGVLGAATKGYYNANGKKAQAKVVVVPAVNELVSASVRNPVYDGSTLTIEVSRPEELVAEEGIVTVFVNGVQTEIKQGSASAELVNQVAFGENAKVLKVYLPVSGEVGDPFVVSVKYNGAALGKITGAAAQADSVIGKKPSSNISSGSGSTVNQKTYGIKVSEVAHGKVTAPSTAKEGATVKVTATPDAGYKLGSLSVTNSATGVAVSVNGTSFTMPAADVNITATFVADDAKPTTPPVISGEFNDVKKGDWYYDAVMSLKELGIINGVSATEFAPNNNVTRAEFTKMVVELFGVEASASVSAFVDCTAADWYTPYVIAATEAGYVNGESDEWFGAEANITREDICTILGRALNLANVDTQLTFADSDRIADYAVQYVKNLVDAKIINGYEDNTFRAKNLATRAEAAKMIKGAYDIKQVDIEGGDDPGVPNPQHQHKTIAELEKAVGFKVPELSVADKYEITLIQDIDTEIADIRYSDGEDTLIYRAGKGDEDISGINTSFESNSTIEVDDTTIQLRGTKESVYVATWTTDGFTYSISTENGLDEEVVLTMIKSVL